MKIRFKTLVIFLVTFIISSGCSDWKQENIDETINLGNKLSITLEKYRETEGSYPMKLTDLTPAYLKNIPEPMVGVKKWDYVKETDGFYLGVNGADEDLDPVLYRTNTSEEWFMDTR
ncbi:MULTISPECIES: hypothetical protein [Aliiglaciecola]|uniref:hypothetical protein n=1 Tax=Aliiglaciecola TaxID=1406885 RepID=UPI001C08B54A|nr:MULTISPECIES: hypothetical protein [Aliiglaciecola]MBU2878714.1 hypothetical protein [Aliiglaciecola lipolytica]MDO6711389.1 hypothetical protein [Aliiglaciecola sp. 2_MG-2023]MDO6752162.1 hypothetical protein [Aliiglaciecola sp. 1_MG-2023]